MMSLFSTVVCDPSCVSGACVQNNTCSCSEGYEGDICDTAGDVHLLTFMHACTNVRWSSAGGPNELICLPFRPITLPLYTPLTSL